MGSGASSSASISAAKSSAEGEGQSDQETHNSKPESKGESSRSNANKARGCNERSSTYDQKPRGDDHEKSRSRTDGVASKTKEDQSSSRSQKKTEGKDWSRYSDMNEDNTSVHSNDSDDTIVAYALMESYREGGDGLSDGQDENEDDEIHDEIIDKIANENSRSYVVYDVDTIGYYIGHGVESDIDRNTKNGSEKVTENETETEKTLKTIHEVEQSNETEQENNASQNKSNDPFDEFKRIYGTDNPRKTKKKKAAGKQTLILTKIGSQYKYVAVPAYLPGQRTYHARSEFTKGYMERAAKIYTVQLKRPKSKGADTETPSDTTDDTIGTESAGKRGRGKKSPGGLKATKLPSCSLPSNMTPTFYVGGGNGTSLVEAPLVGLGWKRITDKFDERFRLKWVECKSRINYGSFREGEQLVNHVPNSHLLTNKLGLLNSLKEYERVTLSTKGRLPRLRMADFHPETYKLDEKSDRELFLEVYKDNEIWICKPVGMNQGKGIFLIRTREEINQILEEREQKKQQAQKPGRPLMNRIVQRYIMNPLLLDGRKFDVRAYMLVASTVPFLILYHKGYVRLTCMKYSTEDTNLGTHLTNQFVQKKDPNYKELKEDTAWSMDKFNDYINEHVRPDCPVEIEEDWVYNTFTKQMQKIMIHCFNSVKHKLQSRIGFFDLFGLDFMVDTEMKVHLIEVNTNPALHCNCEALKEVIPGVVEETLYVAIECFEKSKKNLQLMPLQSLKNFTILYCGTRANSIAPRSIRSVSPVKENSTADKSKTSGIGGQRRASSPTRQGQRSLTQSTPLYNTNQRRPSEKNDSSNKDSSANSASVKSGKTSSNVKTALSAKPRSDNKTKEDNAGNSDKVAKETTNNDSEATEENKDKEIKTPPKSRGSTVIVDTLSKTTDSLNEATSALGKITQSLNQGSLTDSLLEEVKLKMTHAETTNSSGGTVPNSTPPTRERENLERGN